MNDAETCTAIVYIILFALDARALDRSMKYNYEASPLIRAAIRDDNKYVRALGHFFFGVRCGFPLCCVLQWVIGVTHDRLTPIAVTRGCWENPVCKAEFVHCTFHAWRGHDCQTHRTRFNS